MTTRTVVGLITALVVSLYAVTRIEAVPRDLFYSYGNNLDKELPPRDDASTDEIPLKVPITFYNTRQKSIFVNTNGHLSFTTEVPGYKSNLIIPIGLPIIAAFLADIDTRTQGQIFYREETDDKVLLKRASTAVQKQFSRFAKFQATGLFIATWEKVGRYNQRSDKANTFQIILASDGRDSFSTFYYLDNGIQWIRADGKSQKGVKDIMAQAGFESPNGRDTIIPGSRTPDAYNFANWTNTDTPGAWMYHIGVVPKDVEMPDLNIAGAGASEVLVSAQQQTCSGGGSSTCHKRARCVDYNQGYCCRCEAPLFGNGRNCIEPGVPQRVNGKFSGTINGVTITDSDIHCYIVTSSGRTYTAVSRIPAEIGPSMVVLTPIAGIVSWLFAKPTHNGIKNGYMLAGATFRRDARIHFPATNQTVQLVQIFTGHDAHNYMTMNTRVQGEIPRINGQVFVPKMVQAFRRTLPGRLESSSSHQYTANGVPYTMTIQQTVTYEECRYDPSPVEDMRVSFQRVNVAYNEKETTVRYSSANHALAPALAAAAPVQDPCQQNGQRCGQNAACIKNGGGTFQCQCKPGYVGNGVSCRDVDECATGRDNCDVNAQCLNTRGRFTCHCRPGYRGDGQTCTKDLTCNDLTCSANANCFYDNENRKPRCQCKSGFRGDGVTCTPVEFACNEVDTCHDNAECVYDNFTKRFECQCNEGYSGDGESCEDTGDPEINCKQCDVNAKCIYDTARLVFRCQCEAEYTGDGRTCSKIDQEFQCNVLNNCDAHAACVYEAGSNRYECRCNFGYRGDGLNCQREPQLGDCSVLNNCHVNAYCRDAKCSCRIGYKGDGYTCTPSQCNADRDICDRNARCYPDNVLRRYVCRCNNGYVGDGTSCTRQVEPCNVVNNCGANAVCNEFLASSYKCRCLPGYEGDGYSCIKPPDCRQNPNLCDRNAACLRSGEDYVCLCNRGYRGDGKRCTAVIVQDSYLLYAQGMSIMKVPFRPTQSNAGRQVLMIPGQTAVAIDVDCADNYFYWSDVSGRSISRAKLDGSSHTAVVTGLGSPEGVAVDWISRNLYWTDSVVDKISVSRLDGSNRKTLVDTGLKNPRAIVVNPARGKMYWSDWNRAAPKIETSNMDGTERKVFVNQEISLPNGLTIDHYAQQLCWGDAGTQRLECIRLDGVGRRVVYALALYPFDVTTANGNLYWTDWHMRNLPNVPEQGGVTNSPLTLPPGGNGKLYGLVAVRRQCPAGSNACSVNNGDCRFLCLPTPSGRRCACPGGSLDDACNEVVKLKL